MKKQLLLLPILFILLTTCKIRYAELGIKRKSYDILPFKTNGYYYNLYQRAEDEYINVFFYYKNALELHWGNQLFVGFDKLENGISNKYARMSVGSPRNRWAVFEIKGDTLELETWTESMRFKKGTFKMYYRIINDTTLYSIGLDKYYHFKEFSPKPDSTLSPIH